MKNPIPILLFLPVLVLAQVSPRIDIRDARGRYQLNFDATYVTYINQDIETAITLPDGYTFTASMPGSRDFVSVGPLQNTIYISKPVNHPVLTNLTLHVETPEKTQERLIFELVGNDKSPKVYAIAFDRPNSSERNRTIEAIKTKYTQQLAAKLSEQEKSITETFTEGTLKESYPLFFNCHRGDISEDYKGATVFLDGIITHEQNSYVYMRSTVKREDCNVVRLVSVKVDKFYNSPAELISTEENADGTINLVYRIQALPTKKKTKVKFDIEIWSKKFTLTQKIS